MTDPATPLHLAVIMDGNGRWARARGRPRFFGHRAGVEAVRRTVRAAGEQGVSHLTLYGFSTENWRRPASEVSALMDLLREYVATDLEKLHAEGVRVRIIGAREGLDADIAQIIANAESRTKDNTAFNLTIAFNYGARDELTRAARALAVAAVAGTLKPHDIGEADIEAHLDTADLPPVDLLVRTSGERRISNFLLWQCAYAEFVFIDEFWPDFDARVLAAVLEEYATRERRYGGVGHADAS